MRRCRRTHGRDGRGPLPVATVMDAPCSDRDCDDDRYHGDAACLLNGVQFSSPSIRSVSVLRTISDPGAWWRGAAPLPELHIREIQPERGSDDGLRAFLIEPAFDRPAAEGPGSLLFRLERSVFTMRQ